MLIKPPEISLPKGGGAIKGIGETFQPDSFSGTGSYSIPFALTNARELNPQISINYNSGSGNSPFGIGFSIGLEKITLRTELGIPKYDGNDTYLLNGVELVPDLQKAEKKGGFTIQAYFPRIQKDFLLIRHYTKDDYSESYWEVTNSENVTTFFGKTENARIFNPKIKREIFEWLVQETINAKGDKIIYTYKAENNENVPVNIENEGHSFNNKYIQNIRYGNYFSSDEALFAFEVIFDYGEYDLTDLSKAGKNPYLPTKEWSCRPDSFSSFTSGFEIRTCRLCSNILLFHCLEKELGSPCLTKRLALEYDGIRMYDTTKVIGPSTLKKVTCSGYRRAGMLGTDPYTFESLPPITLGFSQFKSPGIPQFNNLKIEGNPIPGDLDVEGFNPIDLNSEGISGLLYTEGGNVLYCEPEGDGEYAFPKIINEFPISHQFENGEISLVDIEGNGMLSLISNINNLRGYYKRNSDNTWDNFKAFGQNPTVYGTENLEQVSLNHNGMTDLLLAKEHTVEVYQSEGIKGYEASVEKIVPSDFPLIKKDYKQEFVGFANIFGDGLAHRVRIADGSVSCWPDLGYGNFGEKISLGNAPRFNEEFNIDRLFFADINGSGTTDIVYAYPDHIAIYINQEGNSFSNQIILKLPETYNLIDQIAFADILGNGTTCLVFTKTDNTPRHYYYDFIGKIEIDGVWQKSMKPYLLHTIDNNLGAITQIQYCSSVRFYLEDKKAGTPWITKLPFPIQLVEKIIQTDQISGALYTRRFKYHDGYYDTQEGQFRGFGYVESWDTEDYEDFRKKSEFLGFETLEQENYVPPVYTRTWHNTGVPFEEAEMSAYYKAQYFKGDPKAYDFPDSVFSPEIYQQGTETLRQAFTALKGQIIRTEVYAEDKGVHPELYQNPYTVTESNATVTLYQQKKENDYAVFMVNPRESIEYHYERNPADPRIQQQFTIETDNYGNVIQACTISLPRRTNPDLTIYPEQQQLSGVLNWEKFAKPPLHFLYCHTSCESQSFELYGIDLENAAYFSYDKIKGQILSLGLPNRDKIVSYGQKPTSGIQAGQLTWSLSIFWNEEQTMPLSPGNVSLRKLIHHQEQAVFTKAITIDTFEGRLIDAETYKDEGYLYNVIYTKGGYFFDENSGYWWNKGLVQHYFNDSHPEAFYMTSAIKNTFAIDTQPTETPQDSSLCSVTTVLYDGYYLRSIEIIQELSSTISNNTTAVIDYITLQPKEIIDLNGNTSQVLFDPLGQVIVTSLIGTEKGKPIGGMTLYPAKGIPAEYRPLVSATFEEVIANPEIYLQGACTYFYYNLNAWTDSQQPASAVNLIRNEYWNSPQKDETHYCQVAVSYNDGLGRDIEKKLKVDPGLGYLVNATDRCELQLIDNRWQVTGRTVYNNKGKVFAKYNPYYTDTPVYESQKAICVPPPTVTYYDALEREIRIDTPKGFFLKITFTPWEVIRYDESDTVLDAPYFLKNYPDNVSPEEKAALQQAIKCYNTPSAEVLNNLGQSCFKIQNNLGNVTENAFENIVIGTDITSLEIWSALKAAGYLQADIYHPSYTLNFLTQKFQPYTPGFVLELPEKFNASIPKITSILKQNCLTEYYTYDILSNVKSSIDPRLYYDNVTKATGYYNFHYQYAMDKKNLIYVNSADAGIQKHLANIYGQQLWAWSPRNYCQLLKYDRLQRKTELLVKKIIEPGVVSNYQDFNLVEVFTYGETMVNAQESNLKGQLYELKDLSGIIINSQYNMAGELLQTERQFVNNYKEAANWNLDPLLEPEKYITSYRYNAIKQLCSETTPDDSVTTKTYNQAGALNTIKTNFADGTSQEIINKITYDANGQRVEVIYGNGISTEYEYEDTTLRLLAIKSKKSAIADVQDLAYTYDPVGNITNLVDHTIDTVFHNNQKVDPVSVYGYDALYRLTKATGRQHIGINDDTYKNNRSQGSFMQSIFGPPPSANDSNKLENYTETFTYDDSGNLVLKKHTAVSNSWIKNLAVEENCNRLLGLEYDNSGNMRQLEINNPVEMSFNCCDNFVKAAIIKRPDELDDSDYYLYDGEELRTRKVSERMTNGGDVTLIEDKIYLGNYEIKRNYKGRTEQPSVITFERKTLRIMDDKTCVAIIYYITKDTKHPEKEGTRQCRFQMDDNLGSVSLEMDTDANLISYEEYFPYGGTAIITGVNEIKVSLKEYRYTGKEADDSTGLYYYGARYYASWLGCWLQPDPAGTVDGLNLYGFVKGNPIKHVDSDGLSISNKYEWEVDSSTSYVSPYSDLNAVIDNFGKPTTSVVKTYEDLASRVGYDVSHGGKLQSTTVSDLHLMFEASVPLHYGFNDFLGDEWRSNMGAYSGSKRRVPLYSVMRSKTTTQFKSETSIPGFASLNEVLYEVSQRPAEVHHILYKAVRPQYANQTSNLMLVQRSAKESVEGPGQHELMHKVGSGNDSDKFRVLLPEFEAEYIKWYMAKQSVTTMQVSSIQ